MGKPRLGGYAEELPLLLGQLARPPYDSAETGILRGPSVLPPPIDLGSASAIAIEGVVPFLDSFSFFAFGAVGATSPGTGGVSAGADELTTDRHQSSIWTLLDPKEDSSFVLLG